MRRLATLAILALAVLAGTAQAYSPGSALLHARSIANTPAVCPADVPVQTITITNQANVQPFELAKIENAIVAQSLQLRAAWSTPCVQFGPGGWPLYLQIGDTRSSAHGQHFFSNQPYAIVWTSGRVGWSVVLSHEILEMLVDPTLTRDIWHDGQGSAIEIADAVEGQAYCLHGVYVVDFVLPSWFASDAGAPYDQMGILASPWQALPN